MTLFLRVTISWNAVRRIPVKHKFIIDLSVSSFASRLSLSFSIINFLILLKFKINEFYN